MSRELRIEYEHAFYHVISRGNTRSRIFKNESDRRKFLGYLQEIHDKFQVKIHAYCLMRNHYHLLMETPKANLRKVMHTLNTSYTNYYNYWNKRCGHLFSGRYKAILVEKDSYAQILSSYIHLNPLRAKLVNDPCDYEWSSCKYYCSDEEIPEYLDIEFILGYFGDNPKIARTKYIDYLKIQNDRKIDPLSDVKSGIVLGSDAFLKYIRENSERKGWINRPFPEKIKLIDNSDLEEKVRDYIKNQTMLNKSEKRRFLIYLLRKSASMELKAIGKEFKISDSGVCKLVKRLKERIEQDDNYKRIIEEFKK